MLNKTVLVIVSVFFLLFECCGCTNANESRIKYQMKYFSREFGKCDSISNYCARVKADYPFFTESKNPFIKDTLNNQIYRMITHPVFDWKINSLEKLADSLIADYKRLKNKFPDAPLRYELERSVTVTLNKRDLISIEFDEYSFLGGAHPNSLILFSNINSKTGLKISLDQLFISGFDKELNSIGEKRFREARGLKPEDDLERSGFWFKDNKFALTANFLITKSGIKFYFNDYEVAPHAVGPTEIYIPFDEIKKFIIPGGILSEILQ